MEHRRCLLGSLQSEWVGYRVMVPVACFSSTSTVITWMRKSVFILLWSQVLLRNETPITHSSNLLAGFGFLLDVTSRKVIIQSIIFPQQKAAHQTMMLIYPDKYAQHRLMRLEDKYSMLLNCRLRQGFWLHKCSDIYYTVNVTLLYTVKPLQPTTSTDRFIWVPNDHP